MSWSIFGRLFWKVWREDWKRWASVLAVGVVAYLFFSSTPLLDDSDRNTYVVMSAFIFMVVGIAVASVRGNKDRLDANTIATFYRTPSMVLIVIWSSISAILPSLSLYLETKSSYGGLFPFIMLLMVSTGLIGYVLGQWVHPWFSAILLIPVVGCEIENYYARSLTLHTHIPYPAFTALNLAVATVIIVAAASALSSRCNKRIPISYQFIGALCILWAIAAYGLVSENRAQDITKSRITSDDNTLEARQKTAGLLYLQDRKTGRSFTINTRRFGDWSAAIPVGICRNRYVLAIAFNKQLHTNSLIRWDYLANRVTTLMDLGNRQYFINGNEYRSNFDGLESPRTTSDDGRYVVMRLKTKLGRGCDYCLIDIRANILKVILANVSPKYDIEVNNHGIATLTDRERNSTRILELKTANLGPVVEWTGDHK